MSARTRLLFSEAWSSITANISTTFAATMTVLIGMFLLGLFIALGTWVLSWSNHVKKELQVHVYFTSTATPQQMAFVGQQIRKDQRVKLVTFVSKAAAEKQMRKKFPQLYSTLLPATAEEAIARWSADDSLQARPDRSDGRRTGAGVGRRDVLRQGPDGCLVGEIAVQARRRGLLAVVGEVEAVVGGQAVFCQVWRADQLLS